MPLSNIRYTKQKSRTTKHIAGFCQLQGPTGSGKTSALYRSGFADNVPPALETIKIRLSGHSGYPSLEYTPRHLRKTVSHEDSNGKPFNVSVLYAQDEQIVSAIEATPLPHEKDISVDSLPDPFNSINELEGKTCLSTQILQTNCVRIAGISFISINH